MCTNAPNKRKRVAQLLVALTDITDELRGHDYFTAEELALLEAVAFKDNGIKEVAIAFSIKAIGPSVSSNISSQASIQDHATPIKTELPPCKSFVSTSIESSISPSLSPTSRQDYVPATPTTPTQGEKEQDSCIAFELGPKALLDNNDGKIFEVTTVTPKAIDSSTDAGADFEDMSSSSSMGPACKDTTPSDRSNTASEEKKEKCPNIASEATTEQVVDHVVVTIDKISTHAPTTERVIETAVIEIAVTNNDNNLSLAPVTSIKDEEKEISSGFVAENDVKKNSELVANKDDEGSEDANPVVSGQIDSLTLDASTEGNIKSSLFITAASSNDVAPFGTPNQEQKGFLSGNVLEDVVNNVAETVNRESVEDHSNLTTTPAKTESLSSQSSDEVDLERSLVAAASHNKDAGVLAESSTCSPEFKPASMVINEAGSAPLANSKLVAIEKTFIPNSLSVTNTTENSITNQTGNFTSIIGEKNNVGLWGLACDYICESMIPTRGKLIKFRTLTYYKNQFEMKLITEHGPGVVVVAANSQPASQEAGPMVIRYLGVKPGDRLKILDDRERGYYLAQLIGNPGFVGEIGLVRISRIDMSWSIAKKYELKKKEVVTEVKPSPIANNAKEEVKPSPIVHSAKAHNAKYDVKPSPIVHNAKAKASGIIAPRSPKSSSPKSSSPKPSSPKSSSPKSSSSKPISPKSSSPKSKTFTAKSGASAFKKQLMDFYHGDFSGVVVPVVKPQERAACHIRPSGWIPPHLWKPEDFPNGPNYAAPAPMTV